jgi:hypothetical protein
MYFRCPSWFLGVLITLTGIPVIRSALHLWRDPDSLKPDSFWYKNLVVWLRVWQPALRKKRTPSDRLTVEDIKFFAVLDLIGGIALIVIGVMQVLEGWLLK